MLAANRGMLETITSRRHAIVGLFRTLAREHAVGECRILLDGIHLVEEARAAGLPILVAAIATKQTARLRSHENSFTHIAAELVTTGTRVVRVSGPVMAALSPVRSSSGLVAIAERTPVSLEHVLAGPAPLVVVLADLQDPGNVGAVIRAADAGGATGVVVSGRSADPFGWKALRGAMGSVFRLPVVRHENARTVIPAARERGLRVLAAVPHGGRPFSDADLAQPTAVLLGGEGAGLVPELVHLADEAISVPMRPPVESLNVAVTAALVVYEAARQRGEHGTRDPLHHPEGPKPGGRRPEVGGWMTGE